MPALVKAAYVKEGAKGVSPNKLNPAPPLICVLKLSKFLKDLMRTFPDRSCSVVGVVCEADVCLYMTYYVKEHKKPTGNPATVYYHRQSQDMHSYVDVGQHTNIFLCTPLPAVANYSFQATSYLFSTHPPPSNSISFTLCLSAPTIGVCREHPRVLTSAFFPLG